MKKKDVKQIICDCGEPQGKLEGYWWVYPNPMMCKKCGKSYEEKFLEQVMNL